jgi:hypothetical protein
MSHVSSYATQICFRHVAGGGRLEDDPAFEILQQAAQAVAEAHGGRITQSVADVFGRQVRCDLAVSFPEFRQGIGIKIDRKTGELSFLYDAYGKSPELLQGLTGEIVQNYTSIAVARALQEMHYEVDLEESGTGADRRVVVRGVL